MKFLITGGAGFIGSAVIRYIIGKTEDSVINLDSLTYAGNLKSIQNVIKSQRYSFEQVDICNKLELERVFKIHQPDAVMHLAAESHVDRSIDESFGFIQTNIIGTYNLLEVSRKYWQELDHRRKMAFRFHHISTDEVYGDLKDTESLFKENSPYAPSSPYSATKASSDHLVRSWMRTYNLPTLVSNCSNNYGPYQFPEKLIPHMILNALEGKSLTIYGNGKQIRDWLYVEDHAQALYLIITQGKIGETYNIGGYNERSNIEVVEIICELLEKFTLVKPVGINKYSDLIVFVKDRPGHDVRYAIDASKIKRELGWKAEENFEMGIKKTIRWYLDNKEWWSKISEESNL